MCFRIWELLVVFLSLSNPWLTAAAFRQNPVLWPLHRLSPVCSGRGNLCWPLITQTQIVHVKILTIYQITHHYSIAELQVSEIHNSIALSADFWLRMVHLNSGVILSPLPDVRSQEKLETRIGIKMLWSWFVFPCCCEAAWGLADVLYCHSVRESG